MMAGGPGLPPRCEPETGDCFRLLYRLLGSLYCSCQLTTASVSSTAAPSPPKSRVLEDGGRGAQSEGWEYSPCRLEDVLTEAQT